MWIAAPCSCTHLQSRAEEQASVPTCNPSTEHPCSALSWEIKAFLCAHPQSIILPAPHFSRSLGILPAPATVLASCRRDAATLPSPSCLDLGSAHPQNPVPSAIHPGTAPMTKEPAWHQLHPCWPRGSWLSPPPGGDPVLGAVAPQD